MFEALDCLFTIAGFVGIVIAIVSSVKVVSEYQSLVVFRLGRPLDKPKGPGLVFLFPFLDRSVKVDLRDQMHEVLHAEAVTKDDKAVSFAFQWYYKIVDPVKSVRVVLDPKKSTYVMTNYEVPIADKALNLFQAAFHEVDSSDLMFERERTRNMVFSRLEEVIPNFGVKLVKLEITNLDLKDIENKL